MAVALTLYEQGLCSGCGHPVAESQSPLADPTNPDRTHRYEVPPPVRCHACDAVERRAEGFVEATRPSALRFYAVRKDETGGR